MKRGHPHKRQPDNRRFALCFDLLLHFLLSIKPNAPSGLWSMIKTTERENTSPVKSGVEINILPL